MKTILLLCSLMISCANVNSSNPDAKDTKSASPSDAANLFTLADAAMILGEPCHTIDSTYSAGKDVKRFNNGYKADSRDSHTGDTGAIYFVFEVYDNVDAAHNRYTFIRDANRKSGIRELTDMGDEAYYHTDNTHFRFIMARKNNRIIVMKINKITSHTSYDAFDKISKRIVGEM